MKPGAVAHDRRKLPALGQPLPNDHVVQADDLALDVGDVAAEQVNGLDHAGEALRQDRVERDLPQVVQQAAEERVGRVDRRLAGRGRRKALGQQFGAAGDRHTMLPELAADTAGGVRPRGREGLEDPRGEDRVAHGLEAE